MVKDAGGLMPAVRVDVQQQSPLIIINNRTIVRVGIYSEISSAIFKPVPEGFTRVFKAVSQ